jgi:hypothetical protein
VVIDYLMECGEPKATEIIEAFKLAKRSVRKDGFRFRFLRAGNGYVVVKDTDREDGQ